MHGLDHSSHRFDDERRLVRLDDVPALLGDDQPAARRERRDVLPHPGLRLARSAQPGFKHHHTGPWRDACCPGSPSFVERSALPLGGVAAVFAALSHPEVFGNALAQSGAFWYGRHGEAEEERLDARLNPITRQFESRCPRCSHEPGWTVITGGNSSVFAGITGLRPALSRLLAWGHDYYRHAVAERTVPCVHCGQPATIEVRAQRDLIPPFTGRQTLIATCTSSARHHSQSVLAGFGLCLPIGQHFWRAHPRLLILPERHIDMRGERAIVARFEDRASVRHLEVVFSLETLQTLVIHET